MFYLQQYFSWRLFSKIVHSRLFGKCEQNLWQRSRDILRWNFYGWKYSKKWAIVSLPLSIDDKALLKCYFTTSVIRSTSGGIAPEKLYIEPPFWTGKNLKGGCRQRGKLLPIHSRKWNQNDVFTTYKAIIKGLPAGLFTDHANYHHIPKIDGFFFLRRNKIIYGGRRRDCFPLLYFSNWQIY